MDLRHPFRERRERLIEEAVSREGHSVTTEGFTHVDVNGKTTFDRTLDKIPRGITDPAFMQRVGEIAAYNFAEVPNYQGTLKLDWDASFKRSIVKVDVGPFDYRRETAPGGPVLVFVPIEELDAQQAA